MSVLLDVADALAAELNGHSFSQEFAATRTYADWDEELTNHDLRAEVVPVGGLPTDLETRGSVTYSCSVDIALRKKLGEGQPQGHVDPSVVDPLVSLIEEINEWTIGRCLATYEAAWESTNIQAAVSHQHLRDFNQFLGIIRVTYRVDRCLT